MARMLDRLENLDRRIIFACVFLAIVAPLFRPIGLPIVAGPAAQGFYDAIEQVPSGATVFLAADYDPGSMPELQPMLETAMRQLCRKKVKIVAASLWPACPPLVDGAFRRIAVGEFQYQEGTDFVNLGFKEGKEVVMVQLGDDIRRAYPTDAQNRPLDSIPVMQNIRRLGDMPLMVNISAGYPGTKEWVQQVQSRYSVRMVSGCTAVSTPEYFSYFQSRQLVGLLGGLAGAAEYEKLAGMPGSATKGMDAQSLGHLAIIGFILVGNIVFFMRKREGLA